MAQPFAQCTVCLPEKAFGEIPIVPCRLGVCTLLRCMEWYAMCGICVLLSLHVCVHVLCV